METCQLTPAENLIIVLQVLALKISIHTLLCYTGVNGSNFTEDSSLARCALPEKQNSVQNFNDG